jgi:hypothetical protein
MKKWEWVAVGVALGAGVVAQIPDHDDMSMTGHSEMEVAASSAYRTASLDITGMT